MASPGPAVTVRLSVAPAIMVRMRLGGLLSYGDEDYDAVVDTADSDTWAGSTPMRTRT
ncbi:hypothetical protein [Streptomyces sp. Inha503]|uniref:hypothetical protein n=1 Tax=Streptomyces sp. Inha503 TaxID=3383314 RepID=UPI0039A3E938